MRATVISVSAFALFSIGMPVSANAQMCGPGQQAQASTPAQGGGMCGMGQAADDPMADKPTQPLKASGMCPCCKNMATMMKGGMMGGHKDMPGMEMPKQ